MIVALKYFIIFEPSEAWQSEGQFADNLEAFFRSNGYVTNYVDTSNNDENILFLQKVDETIDTPPQQPTRVASLKQEIAQQTQKRGFDGKFKKGDGR